MVGEGDVCATSGGENVRGGVDVGKGADCESAVLIVDLSAAGEEVDVRTETSDGVIEADAAEGVLLGRDAATVEGVSAARLKSGIDAAEWAKGEVYAGGDGEVFATGKAGEVSGSRSERREMQPLSRGGDSLGWSGAALETKYCRDEQGC